MPAHELAHCPEVEVGILTCNRPFSSRSPLSFTKTISSRDKRTRSSGSLTEFETSSSRSAILEEEELNNGTSKNHQASSTEGAKEQEKAGRCKKVFDKAAADGLVSITVANFTARGILNP